MSSVCPRAPVCPVCPVFVPAPPGVFLPVLYCTGYRVLVCCSVTCFEILYTGSGSWALSMCDMLINPDLEATPLRFSSQRPRALATTSVSWRCADAAERLREKVRGFLSQLMSGARVCGLSPYFVDRLLDSFDSFHTTSVSQSVSYFTVPPRAHPSTGSHTNTRWERVRGCGPEP